MSFLTVEHRSLFSLARAVLLVATLGPLGAGPGFSQGKPSDSSVLSVPIYVSDFELNSVPATPKPKTPPPGALQKPKPPAPLVYEDTDQPSAQARRLTDFFAMTLVQTLGKKGFSATRLAGPGPQSGAQIRGVFAEPDTSNRIRRALLGSGAPNARFLLYVGIFNLGREPQPLYQPATIQQASNDYGPIITLNNYIPLAKYEVDKSPTEEDVQKICNQIAASLATLLANNPSAFTQ
jgi:hypothetical protein